MPSLSPIDVDAYLARIGYAGPASAPANLETLRAIQFAHVCSVPFENLDVLIDRPISLDPMDIHRKLVSEHRGGYCFELNGLLIEVLKMLGFSVEPLSARVRFAATRDMTPPRTHLFARVTIDDVPWCVDVGVGGLSPSTPFRMDTDEAQSSPHDTRRIVRDGLNGNWFHQLRIDDEWRDVCEFTGEHMPGIDRRVANWWTSTNPESKFRQNIMAALALPDGSRYTLQTREFTHRSRCDVLAQECIESSAQLHELLRCRFNLTLPPETRFGIDGL